MSNFKNEILSHFNGNFEGFYQRYLPPESLKSLRRERNGEFKCLCCFHPDTEPSLNLNYQTGSWHCFGEKVGGDVFSFYARKHNLNIKIDFQKILAGIAQDFGIDNSQGKTQGLGKIVKTYGYQDKRGNLIFQVVRYEPKDFRQRQPDGKGGWTWSLMGVRRILYNLSAVLKASEVLVCEGEKDSDRLNASGLVATTNPQGAGKWRKEYTKILAGKDIVLFPHNDDPGKKHMLDVANELYGIARSVKVIELPVDKKGGDVCDWLDALGDDESGLERLSLMIEGVEPWRPEGEQKAEILSWEFDDLTNWQLIEPPPLEWAFDGLIPKRIVAAIFARGGTGKTYFIEAMILGAITGRKVFRLFDPMTPKRVLALLSEDPPEVTRSRFYWIGETFISNDLSRQNLQDAFNDNLKLLCTKAAPLMQFDGKGNPECSTAFDWLKGKVEAFRPHVIFIDPKSQFYGLEEQSNDHNTTWVNTLKELTLNGATVIFAHHVPKKVDAFSVDALRGGGALGDACRWAMGMQGLDEIQAKDLDIEDPWNYVHCRITKNSYAPLDGADFFFKRGQRGELQRVEPRASWLEAVAGRISEVLQGHYNQGGNNLTQRAFVRDKEAKKLRDLVIMDYPKVNRKTFEQAIQRGINQGLLSEIEGQEKSRSRWIVKYLKPGGCLI